LGRNLFPPAFSSGFCAGFGGAAVAVLLPGAELPPGVGGREPKPPPDDPLCDEPPGGGLLPGGRAPKPPPDDPLCDEPPGGGLLPGGREPKPPPGGLLDAELPPGVGGRTPDEPPGGLLDDEPGGLLAPPRGGRLNGCGLPPEPLDGAFGFAPGDRIGLGVLMPEPPVPGSPLPGDPLPVGRGVGTPAPNTDGRDPLSPGVRDSGLPSPPLLDDPPSSSSSRSSRSSSSNSSSSLNGFAIIQQPVFLSFGWQSSQHALICGLPRDDNN
jgi:hypothetical protein